MPTETCLFGYADDFAARNVKVTHNSGVMRRVNGSIRAHGLMLELSKTITSIQWVVITKKRIQMIPMCVVELEIKTKPMASILG